MERPVLLIRNIAPQEFGGAEIYQIEIAKVLAKNQLTPIIVTSSKKLQQEAKKCGFKAVAAPFNMQQNWSSWRNFLMPLYFLKQRKLTRFYKNLYRTYHPIAVNIQSRDDQIAGTLAAKHTDIKVFWTDHADYRNWVLWNIDKPLKNFIGKKIVKLAKRVEAIVAISDYEKAFIKKAFKKTNPKIIVVKNGVEDEKEKYGKIKIKPNSFCFAGRVVNDKGINELLVAFEKVREHHPKISLSICGDGPLLPALKEKYGKTVDFCGYLDDILKKLAEAEYYILPSYKEGLSFSLINAAMMQKTIITTNVGASSEVIENKKSGLLIESENVDAIVEAMEYVLDHPKESEKMAAEARNKYLKEFILSKNIEQNLIPLIIKD